MWGGSRTFVLNRLLTKEMCIQWIEFFELDDEDWIKWFHEACKCWLEWMDNFSSNNPPTQFASLASRELLRDDTLGLSVSDDARPLLPAFGAGMFFCRPLLDDAIQMIEQAPPACKLTPSEKARRITELCRVWSGRLAASARHVWLAPRELLG